VIDPDSDLPAEPCACCTRLLKPNEIRTCARCVERAREQLRLIDRRWFELPREMGQLTAQRFDRGRPAADDGQPLPGGDALVLMSAGSDGLDDDETTALDDDPPSVAFELAWWETRWRSHRGQDPAPPRHRDAVITGPIGYLMTCLDWASRTPEAGFCQFLDDLRTLRARLDRATGHSQTVWKAEAECFTCGQDQLQREVTEQGYADDWTCQVCGARYDWARYVLACAARVDDGRSQLRESGWGTPAQVGAATGTPVETVRTWAKRGQVSAACLLNEKRELVVWFPEVHERAERLRVARERAEVKREVRRQQARQEQLDALGIRHAG
jgi:hypothetical protein